MLSKMISSVKSAEKEADVIVSNAEDYAAAIESSAEEKAVKLRENASEKAGADLSEALEAVRTAAAHADSADDERTANDIARLKESCRKKFPDVMPKYMEIVFSD